MCKSATPGVVVKSIQKQLFESLEGMQADLYFTSEKVLLPDLNSPVNWNTAHQTFGLDTSRYVVTKNNNQIDNSIVEMANYLLTEKPPVLWLKNELKNHELAHRVDSSDDTIETFENNQLNHLKKELERTYGSILLYISKLERLIALEENLSPLLEKRKFVSELEVALFQQTTDFKSH